MTVQTYDVMPMGVIDAVDPYPFHGLVYKMAGTGFKDYLDPMDGRPAIDLPARPSTNDDVLPSYTPSLDGCVWDIGREDPPQTPAILAAGGRALGRRVLERSSRHPARLGDRTYQIELFTQVKTPDVSPSPISIYWRIYKDTGPLNFIADIDHADLDVNFSNLCGENGQMFIRPGGGVITRSGVSVFNNPDAISSDGTRRLLRCGGGINRADGVNVTTFEAGYVEVVFSLDINGDISASASVVKTCPQVLGSYSRSGSSTLKTLELTSSGGPACTYTFALVDADPLAVSAPAGHHETSITRSGIIVGAVYVGDDIQYYSLSQAYRKTDTATRTREPYAYGTPDPVDPTFCQMAGAAPPSPIVESNTEIGYGETTITFGAYSLTGSITYSAEGSASDGVGTTTASSTSSAGDTVSRSGGWVPIVIFRNSDIPPPPGAVVVPVVEVLSFFDHSLRFVTGLQGWQTLLITVATSNSSFFDLWRAPMITPKGIRLTYARQNGVPRGTYVYRGAYNPLTGQAARNGDVPGRTIEGWL